jgi:hypothetical protein
MRVLGRWWAQLPRRNKVIAIAAVLALAAVASAISPTRSPPVSSEPSGLVAAATATAYPAPLPIGSEAEGATSSPDSTPAIIPGLSAAQVRTMLVGRGMICGPTEAGDGDGVVYECDDGDDVVLVRSRADGIYYIDTTAVSFATDPVAGQNLISFIASLPFDRTMPSEARQWVANNIREGGEFTTGSVYLLMYPADDGRVLELYRSGQLGQ